MAIIKSSDSNNELIIDSNGAAKIVATDENGNPISLRLINAKLSTINSTSTPLGGVSTFTGIPEECWMYNSVVVSAKTDQAGILYIEFSTDGTNWDSSTSVSVVAGTNEVKRLTCSKAYCRIRFSNTSAGAQTYIRLQTIYGNKELLTSSLNSTIQRDSDTITVRPTDFNLATAEGLYENTTITIKDGFNLDIHTGSVPEDITNEGGTYAGFPTGAVETGEIVVAGADTGTVYYDYLASSTDTEYTSGTKAITGAGTYSLGHNIWRCNSAYFISNSPTTTNVGDITIRNTVTTTNVFCVISATYGQSYCSAYTVPAGSDAYLDRITGSLRGSTNGSLDGFFWYRDSTSGGFRLRFPFELQYGSLYFDDIDYLIRIPAGVDFIPRILIASTNNLQAKISYRITKIKS